MHCLCLGRQALPGGVSLLYAFIQNICSCHECNGSMIPQKEHNFVHTVYIFILSACSNPSCTCSCASLQYVS